MAAPIAMEFVEGETLRARLDKAGVSPETALDTEEQEQEDHKNAKSGEQRNQSNI